MKLQAILCFLLFFLNVAAQEQDSTGNIPAQGTVPTIMDYLHKAQHYLDSTARTKVD